MHLKGRTHFQCVVYHGESHAIRNGRHLCMEPHVRPSALLKPNYIKHMLNIPKGTPSIHPDAFERWGRLPICSFLGGTAMHWRPSVHETLVCGLSTLLNPHKNEAIHVKHRVNNSRGMPAIHPDACEIRERILMCSYGRQPCMGGHLLVESRCITVHPFGTQYTGGNSC